jgi:hypothetical protein
MRTKVAYIVHFSNVGDYFQMNRSSSLSSLNEVFTALLVQAVVCHQWELHSAFRDAFGSLPDDLSWCTAPIGICSTRAEG